MEFGCCGTIEQLTVLTRKESVCVSAKAVVRKSYLLLAGASNGRGPCGALVAFGIDDCLLLLENIGVFFDGALYTGSFEGVASDRLVDALMEEAEGDF